MPNFSRTLLHFGPVMVLFIMAGSLFLSAHEKDAYAAGKTTVYFFWSTGCPHCKDEKAFLAKLLKDYPELDLKSLEIGNSSENAELLSVMAEAYGVKLKGVPALFIGEYEPIVGYQSDDTTGREIDARIRKCVERGCPDPGARLSQPSGQLLLPRGDLNGLTGEEKEVCGKDVECPERGEVAPAPSQADRHIIEEETSGLSPAADKEDRVINLPLFGELDISGDTLLYQTIVIAGLDGFNPCAFFVLFTLLGLLIHVQSRKKLFLVGGIFVFFSGLIYFIFMAAWLNFFLLTGKIAAVTTAAGTIALFIAIVNIKDFFYFGKGVSLVIPDKAKPELFDRMRRLVKAASLPSVILGTVVLASAANIYELFCTAGFPMVYTRILTLRNLPKVHYYLYLVLYNVIYIIPLALIVVFFAVTLGSRKLSQRQGRVLKLVSGMMMLCLGSVLLTKPELLNNIVLTAGLLGISLVASWIIVFATGRLTAENK